MLLRTAVRWLSCTRNRGYRFGSERKGMVSCMRTATGMGCLLFTVTVNFPRMTGQSMLLIGTRSRSVKRAAVLTLQTTQRKNRRASRDPYEDHTLPSHTLLYRQRVSSNTTVKQPPKLIRIVLTKGVKYTIIMGIILNIWRK